MRVYSLIVLLTLLLAGFCPSAQAVWEKVSDPQDLALLKALHQVEASGHWKVTPRHEPGFYARYLKGNEKFAEAEKRYGARAIACSYGPWQIMYATAVEMGYKGTPEDLSHPEVSLPYVLRYLQVLKKRFEGDLTKVVSAYNAGPGGVGTNPLYTQKVLSFMPSL